MIDYSVLKQYLPNVIKSIEEPFGKQYDMWLDKLSNLLMEGLDGYTGFVDTLLRDVDIYSDEQNKAKKQKDITKNNEEQAGDDTSIGEPINTEGKRSSRKSKQNGGTSQP